MAQLYTKNWLKGGWSKRTTYQEQGYHIMPVEFFLMMIFAWTPLLLLQKNKKINAPTFSDTLIVKLQKLT